MLSIARAIEASTSGQKASPRKLDLQALSELGSISEASPVPRVSASHVLLCRIADEPVKVEVDYRKSISEVCKDFVEVSIKFYSLWI
jgi:hypothetical protein